MVVRHMYSRCKTNVSGLPGYYVSFKDVIECMVVKGCDMDIQWSQAKNHIISTVMILGICFPDNEN